MKRVSGTHLIIPFCLFSLYSTLSHADLVSGFDAGAEGWTGSPGIGGAINFAWESTGGNPGGFIAATDGGAQQWYFISPDSWDGDWTPYIDGTLSYDIKVILPAAPPYTYIELPDVQIFSGTGNYASWSSSVDPTNAWTSYAVQLASGNFTVTGALSFEQIMANVTELRIRGEYINGGDREGLDNVRVSAVPVPAAAGLFAIGLLGLLGTASRRTA